MCGGGLASERLPDPEIRAKIVGVACARHFREAAVLVLGGGLPGRRRLAWGSPVGYPSLPALDDDSEARVRVLLPTLMSVAATNPLRCVSSKSMWSAGPATGFGAVNWGFVYVCARLQCFERRRARKRHSQGTWLSSFLYSASCILNFASEYFSPSKSAVISLQALSL